MADGTIDHPSYPVTNTIRATNCSAESDDEPANKMNEANGDGLLSVETATEFVETKKCSSNSANTATVATLSRSPTAHGDVHDAPTVTATSATVLENSTRKEWHQQKVLPTSFESASPEETPTKNKHCLTRLSLGERAIAESFQINQDDDDCCSFLVIPPQIKYTRRFDMLPSSIHSNQPVHSVQDPLQVSNQSQLNATHEFTLQSPIQCPPQHHLQTTDQFSAKEQLRYSETAHAFDPPFLQRTIDQPIKTSPKNVCVAPKNSGMEAHWQQLRDKEIARTNWARHLQGEQQTLLSNTPQQQQQQHQQQQEQQHFHQMAPNFRTTQNMQYNYDSSQYAPARFGPPFSDTTHNFTKYRYGNGNGNGNHPHFTQPHNFGSAIGNVASAQPFPHYHHRNAEGQKTQSRYGSNTSYLARAITNNKAPTLHYDSRNFPPYYTKNVTPDRSNVQAATWASHRPISLNTQFPSDAVAKHSTMNSPAYTETEAINGTASIVDWEKVVEKLNSNGKESTQLITPGAVKLIEGNRVTNGAPAVALAKTPKAISGFTEEEIARMPVVFSFTPNDFDSQRLSEQMQKEWNGTIQKCMVQKKTRMSLSSRSKVKNGLDKKVVPLRGSIMNDAKESPAEHLPEGWTVKLVTRESGITKGSIDRYWFSPKLRKKFRSKTEVNRFMDALEKVGGEDEEKAWALFKG